MTVAAAPTAERVRDATAEVLSRPGYRELVEGPLDRLLLELRGRVAQLLFEVFGDATAARVGQVVAVLVVVVVAVLAVVAAATLRGRRAADLEVAVDATVGWRDEVARADDAAATGGWERAVHHRYAALVLLLADRDVLPLRPGTTVGEVDAAVARAVPARAADVRAAGAALADVAYGHVPATRDHDRTVAAAVDAVDRALAHTRAGAA